jgi:hypothetical protein
MSHLGDTNKMVSATPRMDASAHDDGAIWQTGCDIERELNAANDRIKRLEEAGDILSRYLRDIPYASDYLYQSGERSLRINNWTQAKEDKL